VITSLEKKMSNENRNLIFFQWAMIAVFSILIILLIIQNFSLKKPKTITKSKEYLGMQFEYELKEKLLFKTFPLEIKPEEFFFNKENLVENSNGYLIMLFDLTVCGRCLDDQLKLLDTYRDIIKSKDTSILGIVGIINKSEESDIINRYRTGTIFFPVKFINVEKIYNTFGISQERFIDTPFYVYTSHDFKILDIFKPEYMDIRRFEKWLDIISTQEMF